MTSDEKDLVMTWIFQAQAYLEEHKPTAMGISRALSVGLAILFDAPLPEILEDLKIAIKEN